MSRNSQKNQALVRVQREKVRSERKEDKRFEGEGRAESSISRGGQIEEWRYISGRSPRRKSQCL